MDLPDLLKTNQRQLTLPDSPQTEGLSILRESQTLNFTMQSQEGDNWCWAAVAVSVSRFYNSGSTWTQCSLATAELTQSTEQPVPVNTNCCNTPETCDVIWYLSTPLRRTGNLNTWADARASWEQLKTEIKNTRPLCVRVRWNGGTQAHFLAIVGYTEQDAGSSLPNTIELRDSIHGNSTHNWNDFARTYQGGATWTSSFYTES